MNDAVYEHLVVRKSTPKDKVIRIAIIFILAVALLFGMGSFGTIAFAVVLLLGFLAHTFIFTKLNVEYEYTVLNHDIDVDAIYSRAKRKRQLSFDFQKAEIIAPASSPRVASRKPEKTYDFSSGEKNQKTYAIYMNIDQKNVCILIDGDPGLLNHIRPWMGSKMYND